MGFGGGGEGADYAAEITFERDGSVERGREVVQYTYGVGAIGGGLGRKRLVEFVAYCSEFAPYYRFLHEDAQGNTVATTSLYGDRLDEYDYSDYGAPLHSPVALDGRWIDSIATGDPDISVVTLSVEVAAPNELLGCELRLARIDPQASDEVFASAHVISQCGTEIKLHDPSHALQIAWDEIVNHVDDAARTTATGSANFYDLRLGYLEGVMDNASNGTWIMAGPWYGTPCTFITVNAAPFDPWMETPSPSSSEQR